jgi:hypothetical protein
VRENEMKDSRQRLRRWLRPIYSLHGWPSWELEAPAAATSYLMAMEYKIRSPVGQLFRASIDTELWRRATLLRIGLAMYRLEHGEYPLRLAELMPTYLHSIPIDPYMGQPFYYEPQGLDLPLKYFNFSIGSFDSESLPPDTPFFWSIGAGKMILTRVDRVYQEIEGSEEDAAVRDVSEEFYRFSSDEPAWWNDPVFVFPLPK